MRDLPGVAAVNGRIIDEFRVETAGSVEPVSARFVSIAPAQADRLNKVRLSAGRRVESGSPDPGRGGVHEDLGPRRR